MFGDLLQPTHLIFVLIIALIIFGPKRLPEIGKGLGKGIKEFKSTMNGVLEDDDKEDAKKDVKQVDSTKTTT